MKEECGLGTGCIICGVIIGIYSFFAVMFLLVGGIFASSEPYCKALYFDSEEPNAINLPDLRNLSSSERNSLRAGSYELSSEYYLKMTQYDLGIISLCIQKKFFTTVSACFEIGIDVEEVVICGADVRPDCLPGSIVDQYVGASLWFLNDSTVLYTILDIDSSAIFRKELTNTTTTLSALWYEILNCPYIINLTIAVMFFGILLFICWLAPCLGCCLLCCWLCCPCCQQKR